MATDIIATDWSYFESNPTGLDHTIDLDQVFYIVNPCLTYTYSIAPPTGVVFDSNLSTLTFNTDFEIIY